MDETLHSAARRAVRFFNIVMQRGGLVDPEFEHAMLQLAKEVEKQNDKDKKNEDRRD